MANTITLELTQVEFLMVHEMMVESTMVDEYFKEQVEDDTGIYEEPKALKGLREKLRFKS